VQRARDLNHFCFIDLRDRYGITQVVVSEKDKSLYESAISLGREFVIRVKGKVVERSNKNKNRETGEIEILPSSIEVLNKSKIPPFTIEDNTEGQEEIRMKHRYLDIRRNPIRNNLILRHRTGMVIRNYLTDRGFIEVETPVLIKSTPEGARDFVVPSRMNPGAFYALPQSPQTFKQLLMVGGIDKYFQIVRCFRDEELRADRQPEFTQIDCEISFVNQEDIINTFEGMIKHVFQEVIGVDLGNIPRMTWEHAMKYYGIDKPDTRFDMKFVEINDVVQGKGFNVFDKAELVVGICLKAEVSQKKIKQWIEFVKTKEIGANGLSWIIYEKDGKLKSSVDKFYSPQDLQNIVEKFDAEPGDIMLVMAGPEESTRVSLGRFRLALASEFKLRDPNVFKPLWVVDFPLLEWNEDDKRWNAMHHPFTSPYPEDLPLLETNPGKVRARAYDLVINGTEVGGGSIRIHNREMQMKMLNCLGFTPERAEDQFGFLMRAFEFGAPPHGGLAFGFDRLCCILGKEDSIRPYIAFPKNKEGKDTMIDAPSPISQEQLDELHINVVPVEKKR